ncbi:MAG: ROK family protein [Gaiellaceae bacterium]
MTAGRAIPPLLKDLNERTVLEAIRAGAPISRAEISRRVGISKPTVSQALQSLLGAGLVREAERGVDGPSYGATFFEAVPEAAFVLGLDLGARFVRGAVCDVRGDVRARQDVELAERTAGAALDAIDMLARSLLEAAGASDDLVDSIVLGVPGAVDAVTSRISLAENVAGLEDEDFHDELSRRIGLPVTIENDINLAALGERWRGIARGVDDFVFLSIGTGLGAGLVLRGELHRGHHGAAGELDFARVGLTEDIDPCASAVSALAQRLGAPGPHDPRTIFAAARTGDGVARAVVDEECRRIALHIVPLAAVTDIGLVVLGGGIGANGDLLYDGIRGHLRAWLPTPPRVEASSLGDAAVLTGGLAVALRAARENVFVNRRVQRDVSDTRGARPARAGRAKGV